MVTIDSRRRLGRNKLYPPPDIAWLWHCHRLAPKLYVEYVFKHSGIPPRRLRPLLCRKLQRYIKKGLKVRWVYGQKCILKKAFS